MKNELLMYACVTLNTFVWLIIHRIFNRCLECLVKFLSRANDCEKFHTAKERRKNRK